MWSAAATPGGRSAVLNEVCKSVTLIHRREQLRAAKSIQQKAFANEKMRFFWDTVVEELRGDGILESMILRNVRKTGERREILADEEDGTFGVFVFVGFEPAGTLFEGQLTMKNGYLVTDDDMKTNLPGVFAAEHPRQEPAAGGHRRIRRRDCSRTGGTILGRALIGQRRRR